MNDPFAETALPETPNQGYQQQPPQQQQYQPPPQQQQTQDYGGQGGYQQQPPQQTPPPAPPPPPPPQQQGGYQNNSYSNQGNQNNYGGGYNNNNKGGYRKKWTPPPDVVETPYRPVAMFVDRDFPEEIKTKFIELASRLIGKGITIRYNADDPEFHSRMQAIGGSLVEVYVPFRGFNNVETKYYFNNATSKHIAETLFQGYSKLPNVVQSMMARNVRMVFGNRNDSPSMCVVTWSPDNASSLSQITRETGRSSFMIKLACTYGFSFVNMQDPNCEARIFKGLNIE